jgi:hypothetical protein
MIIIQLQIEPEFFLETSRKTPPRRRSVGRTFRSRHHLRHLGAKRLYRLHNNHYIIIITQ